MLLVKIYWYNIHSPIIFQVALVKHSIGNCTNYGHSKGKIEFDETIQECVAREVNT